MASTELLEQEIAAQNTLVKDLGLQGSEGAIIDEARKKLGELKKSLALAKGGASSKDAGKKKKERLLLKTAKVRFLQVSDRVFSPF